MTLLMKNVSLDGLEMGAFCRSNVLMGNLNCGSASAA